MSLESGSSPSSSPEEVEFLGLDVNGWYRENEENSEETVPWVESFEHAAISSIIDSW